MSKEGHTIFDLPGGFILDGQQAIDNELGSMETPDWIVNNFGINHLSHIGSTSSEDEDIIKANLLGPYWVINHYASYDLNPKFKVVNIASQTYRVAQRCTALYCASKAGLVHMTKVMARELSPKGWQINALAPGKIEDTKMAQITDEQVVDLRGWTEINARAYALNQIPMGRFTNTVEVTNMVYQMFHFPAYVNGAVIDMTGGV